MTYVIWLTNACNLRCRYCYEDKNMKFVSMTKETVDKVVEFINREMEGSGEEKLYIDLHGGEPLLHEDIFEYIVCKIKKDLAVYLPTFETTTNATLINKRNVGFLLKHINSITVSLDGTKETHDFNRKDKSGRGSYELAMKQSLKLLKVLGKKLRVRMTFDSQTVGCLDEDVLHLVDLGFQLIVPVPNIFDNNWDADTYENMKKRISVIKQKTKDKDVFISTSMPLMFKSKAKCNGGVDGKNIFPDGRIFPCTMAAGNEEFMIGDIDMGINYNKIEQIKAYSDEEVTSCTGCFYYNFCDCIRCRIINKLVNNSYCLPCSVQCNFNNILYEVNGYSK